MSTENHAYENFRIRNVLLIFAAYILLSFALYFHTAEKLYVNMVWNVFLAFIPLIFSTWVYRLRAKFSWVVKLALGFLWLIFFPNCLYMVTDFIHISGESFYLGREEYSQLIVSTNMTLWIRLAYIGIGALMGILAGLLSLRMIHLAMNRAFGKFFSGTVLAGVFLLTGFGIYLGRFLRLNSWNILHPHRLLADMFASVSGFSVKFTILYAFFAFAMYLVFCALCPAGDGREK